MVGGSDAWGEEEESPSWGPWEFLERQRHITKKLKKTADWGKVEWPQVLGRRIRKGGAQPALQGAENSDRQRETESGILGCVTV